MNDYLAAKYLSGAKGDAIRAKQQSGNKKKRKHAESSFSIVDSSDTWGSSTLREEDDDTPMVVESRQKAGFKPVKQRPPTPPPASTVAEDEQPTVVPLDEPKRPAGGLQTASELAESTKRAKEKEARQRERALQAIEASQGAGETVYRDATGRARDTKAEKAEARRQAARDMEKNMERMEWGKGLVQRQDKERRKAELEAEAAAPVARYANDARLNAQQKEQMRWNDPMANMLSNKSSGSGSKKKERPTYKGPPPPPNRFGIRPGYRWDGVDRSNGFERKFLQRGNAAKVRKAEAYAYSVDDM